MMPDSEMDSPEEFMSGLQAAAPEAPKMMKPGGGRRVKKSLLEGEVSEAVLRPETATKDITKLMKILTIIRKPEGRILNAELRVKDGTLYFLEIDEATVTALYNLFQEQD